MSRIAMFLARSPGAPMTGRKAVLHTAIAALSQEGHELHLFMLAKAPADAACAQDARGAGVWLGTAPKAGILCSAAASMLGGAHSLNEALFRSRSALAFARSLAGRYDFAIADTIRAAPYANALGVPWHLDLDDLFSARYEKYLERSGELSADLVLGYYRDSVPRIAAAVPNALLRHLLRREAALLRRREIHWAARATSVSLVSPEEAESFAHATARRVHSLPMSVSIPEHAWRPQGAPGANPAFVGGLDYKPNLDALLYYQQHVFPVLKAAANRPTAVDHIGSSPAGLREKFSAEVVNFHGYVDDLMARLRQAAFFVAPIVSGTGIKTKVLEAMAIGLPVVATPHAVAGLKVAHKEHCFICERPADFAEAMRYLRNAQLAQEMGLAARRYVQSNFSMDVLRRRWRDVIHGLTCSPA